jgi:hypothetical protein
MITVRIIEKIHEKNLRNCLTEPSENAKICILFG